MSNAGDDKEIEELRKRAEELRPKFPEVTYRQFIEETPPDTYVYLNDLTATSNGVSINTPDVVLFCEGQNCNGERIFRCPEFISGSSNWSYTILNYECRNCSSKIARFAIASCLIKQPQKDSPGRGMFMKLGQVPAFGPQTPARLTKLVGPDKEIFLQGRRAENRGMGIGAFAYYRRVVENQKNRIIGEIAKVAKLLGSNPETDAVFEKAMTETRFAESVAMVKDFIPPVLMINGHNPLTLLHTALSKGLHNPDMTDEHCLQLAQSIRTILAEFAERVSEALKDDKEIKNALSVLLAVPNGPKAGPENVEPAVSKSDERPRSS